MPRNILFVKSLLTTALTVQTFFAIGTVSTALFSTTSKLMKKVSNDSIGGRGVTYVPNSGEYHNVVLWFHGLGDTADGWASMMPMLSIDDTKFILPTAPARSISLNGGMAMPGWSDVYGLDASSAEDAEGFSESAQRVNTIIQKEVDQGIPAEKIVVVGFSQGGALALHTSLRSTHKLGGCIALSSWLPLRADYPAALTPESRTLPILQVHGDEDMVVGYEWGKGSHELIKTMVTSPPPEFITIEGMGHSSDPDEMSAVRAFLVKTLGL